MKRLVVTILAVLAVAAIAVVEIRLAKRFGQRELAIASQLDRSTKPRISFTRPAAGETDVLPNSFISCDVILPNKGRGVDADTMNEQNILLYRAGDKHPVKVQFNTSGAGDTIVATPLDRLEPSTQYTFEIKPGVKDTAGDWFIPFKMNFTTAAGAATSDFPVAFEKIVMPQTKVMIPGTDHPSAYTCLTIGPDGNLYAGTFDGRIMRYAIATDGILADEKTIHTVQASNNGPRLITGVLFDPKSTAADPILWISHGQMMFHEGRIENADDWTGKISRLRGSQLDQYEDVVINLPRAFKDHLNFQMVFGSDGAIYFCQGSHTSSGSPDRKWNYREEHLLTAATLRLDPTKLQKLPIDVKTDEGGTYDPRSADAPLAIYATGIRSGYDLLWHSNGNLYCGLNGGAAGGNVPAGPNNPRIDNIKTTTQDLLLKIVKDGYYGHPNVSRNEFVLMGGNPTKNLDPQEVSDYPVGTLPEKHFVPPVYDFGKSVSPNGLCEYTGNAFGGALRGKILVTRYSGGKDIIVLSPGSDGNITEAITGIDGFTQFSDPLDIIENPKTGHLYVAEYGGRQITLLKPKEGSSRKVFIQKLNATTETQRKTGNEK